MIDILFYQAITDLKRRMAAGETLDRGDLVERLEGARSGTPVVYNIETTNACNMRCEMCPRTTRMTRPVATLAPETFERVVDQLRPWTDEEWLSWCDFCERTYGIPRDAVSENHFFLYVIPRVIQLHGYGAPLLDRHMARRVAYCSERSIPTYFSCNPANIRTDKVLEIFAAGLSVIKFSVESVDDLTHKQVRGEASDFSVGYRKMLDLFEHKAREGYPVSIVITTLNLLNRPQREEFDRIREAFDGLDAYVYLKSMDQLWYFDGRGKADIVTESIHWSEFCQHPWMSMTVKSDGACAMCMEDFDNEIVLGDARTDSLADIWHGERYRRFREDHLDLTPGIKCTEECDMRLAGEFLRPC